MPVKKKANVNGKPRVATPASYPELRQRGLLLPDIDLKEGEIETPLDFTALSNRYIGRLHSDYAVRHAYALVENAKISEEMVRLKRDIGIEAAKFRFLRRGEFKTKFEMDDALAQNKRFARLQSRYVDLESLHIMVSAVVQSYEGLRNAASREITRRSTEAAPRD
jgi:hypothetical protein